MLKELKREIIYTLEFKYNDRLYNITTDNKGKLKSVSGLVTPKEWESIEKYVKKEFKNRIKE